MSAVDQTLVAKYRRHKDQVGYPFLSWSGRIIEVPAYLSLIATAVTTAHLLTEREAGLHVFTTMVAGVLSFILMKGLSRTCFLLLVLWKSRAQ